MSGAEQREIDDRDVSIGTFVEQNESYFGPIFERIQRGKLPRWHVNIWAVLVPWIWAAARGSWLLFWVSLALDVIAIVCLMQVLKFSPLLAEAQSNAAANATLVARYSNWITTYSWAGWGLLFLGRFWMGSSANRWYYSQYARWRINQAVPSGVSMKRVVLGVLVMAIIVPLTTYRATQLRLDERACFNQIRAAESVDQLLPLYQAEDVPALYASMSTGVETLQSRLDALEALDELTDAQKSERSAVRKELRDLGRNRDLVEDYQNISTRDRFDCLTIDDFPTLARLTPPEDITYRRVADEEAIAAGDEGATKVITQIKEPVEGRKVTIFTYSAESIDISINRLRAQYATAFDAMTNVLRQSLIRVEVAFMQTPWPVVAFLFLALSWAFAGTGTTIFVGASLGFLALFELWQIAMQTMALVVVSTAVCVLVGLPIGIWMAKNKWFRWITEPILDVMQTIPSLSYLVPAVAFFGISQPPAVLATVIFAMPPMIKLTALGILQVPESTKEAAMAFGASHRQLLHKVELPMAIPSIMAGLNQTIMLALSMATISAFIGAEGLGAIVTSALGDAQAGKGLLAGIAIALVAMMIDRILKGIRNSFSRI
ncbi:proline/glycine betaine ABC transporter permease [uncultured Roseobacter sp.]|uniref:ABC transporter permease n=1 Tax=uncultured Roseobacter sp. TaxID=114847 RepID=UPI0026058EB0|nr:ABC transporter permease subunit [uncultured Roseobacter sp.]